MAGIEIGCREGGRRTAVSRLSLVLDNFDTLLSVEVDWPNNQVRGLCTAMLRNKKGRAMQQSVK